MAKQKIVITKEMMQFIDQSMIRQAQCKFCGSRDVVRYGFSAKNVPDGSANGVGASFKTTKRCRE